MAKAKGGGGEGLYVRGRSGQRDMEQGTDSALSKSQVRSSRLRCYICQFEEHLKRDCPMYNHKKSQGFFRNEDQVSSSGADGYDNANVMMTMSIEELLDWIMDSGGSYHITYRRDYLVDFEEYVPELRRNLISLGTVEKEGFTVKIQSAKIKVIKGSLVVLSGTRRAHCVYTLDGHVVTKKALKGRKQLGDYQTGWKIKMCNVFYSCNQRFTQQCTKSRVARHLGVAGIQQQNRSPSSAIGFKTPIDMLGFFGCLASIKQGMLEPVKVKCIFLGYRKGIVSNKLWRLDDITSKVLQGVEFEVEPREDHAFKVEPQGNVGHIAGLQEVQTQDLLDYHSAHDREQLSARKLFRYREDSNEVAFAVAAAKKIYAHNSLTFNDTVACEVISKWNAGLKKDMHDWSNVLRSGSPRVCWIKQREMYLTLLEGQSILSLEGSLSGDCDVEKNCKWSCIYAVGSQEYQVVCTRLDIASADVGMLDKFDHRLQTDVQVFVDFDYSMGRSITVMGRSVTRYGLMIQGCAVSWEAKFQHIWALSTTETEYVTLKETVKEAIWLKGLLTESEIELKLVAVVATGAFTKFGSKYGMDAMLENVPWFIYNTLFILKRMSLNLNLLKEDVANVPVWVKFHGIPMTAFSRSSYAREMIKLQADAELKDTIVVAMPKLIGEGFYMCTIHVEYMWKPLKCLSCKVFGHILDECPRKIVSDVEETKKSLIR
ncbi:zinc finger, CCHC-type containing protein [Tanacetum coccineum]